jgi:TonB family protein
VTFHSSAKVTGVEVVSTSGCEYFDRASVEAAMKIKFQPAIKNGEAQTTVKAVQYTFRRV